jgi:hypothetical protein
MFVLLVNRVETVIHVPDVSPLKTVRDELPVGRITGIIEGEADMRRKVSLVTILSPMHAVWIMLVIFAYLIILKK